MDASKRAEKSFDFAADVSKQQLTLSTAVIALTITFSKELLQGVPPGTRWLLLLSWLAYVISIIAGLMTLMSLTGTLALNWESPATSSTDKSINRRGLRICAIAQACLFLLGTVLAVGYGIAAGSHWPKAASETRKAPQAPEISIQRR